MMASSPLFSPASDKRFWSLVDTLLENRRRKSGTQDDDQSPGELDRAKRMKEDSLLLLGGFESVAHFLCNLWTTLFWCSKIQAFLSIFNWELEIWLDVPHWAKYYTAISRARRSRRRVLEKQRNHDRQEWDFNKGVKRKFDPSDTSSDQENGEQGLKNEKQNEVNNRASSMATKTASLARELKSIKFDLPFAQERCALLEEDNRRLRDRFSKGIIPEEDDPMRLQMEALLAGKSR